MRSVANKLARTLFDPASPADALCQVVLEKSLRLIHDNECTYVLPEKLANGDRIDINMIKQALTTLAGLKFLKMVRVDVKVFKHGLQTRKRPTPTSDESFVIKHSFAYTTSYAPMMDALLSYMRNTEMSTKKGLPTRSYICKVCNLTTWIPELLEKVSVSEWTVLESKTKGTPKNLWKCKNCNNASVILDPLDAHIHGEYAATKASAAIAAAIPLLTELSDLANRWANQGSRLSEYVARQDLHEPQQNVTVVLTATTHDAAAADAAAAAAAADAAAAAVAADADADADDVNLEWEDV